MSSLDKCHIFALGQINFNFCVICLCKLPCNEFMGGGGGGQKKKKKKKKKNPS